MTEDPRRIPDSACFLSSGEETSFMRSRSGFADDAGDPMESTGNLFDVAILIGVGFMIFALSSFGLQDLLSDEDITIVKNPGTAEMEIIIKDDGEVKTLKRTEQQAQGEGQAVGTVYRLEDGRMVWIPEGGTPADAVPATPEAPTEP
ncbi:MAG: DUF2149 domain-containing protein [Coriobacteriia bacterium]|nr:DUF2149 domain-containing protein [Coriobacteriia bacterium]